MLILYLCPSSEFPGNLKALSLLFMITVGFYGLFAFLIQFMCSSCYSFSTACLLQMLMTDRFRLLFSTLTSNSDWRLDTPWTSGSLLLPQQRQPTPQPTLRSLTTRVESAKTDPQSLREASSISCQEWQMGCVW